MKNKHPNAIVVLVLGFAMAGLHLADLLLWSDAETGFATAGSVWLRYIPWLAALVLPYLPARRAANQPTGLQDTCPPLGLCMVLAGAALVTSGVAMGPVAKYAVQYPEMFSTDYRPGRSGPIYCCRVCAAHGCCITAAGRSRVLGCGGKSWAARCLPARCRSIFCGN